jgi:hypothetical protein
VLFQSFATGAHYLVFFWCLGIIRKLSLSIITIVAAWFSTTTTPHDALTGGGGGVSKPSFGRP